MEFINDKIIISFNKFKDFLNSNNINIEINKELIDSLMHPDYVIDKKKDKYISKIKYSEERIANANKKRIEKMKEKRNEKLKKNETVKDFPVEPIFIQSVIDEIINKKPQFIDNPQNYYSQTTRTDSYLFDEPVEINEPTILSGDKIRKPVDIDSIENEIPEDLIDIYEKVDFQEKMINKFVDDINILEVKLGDRDFRILDLKQFNNKYNKILMNIKSILSNLYDVIENSTDLSTLKYKIIKELKNVQKNIDSI